MIKHTRLWPQKPKTPPKKARLSCCARSACTQALGCWKLRRSLWCFDLLSQHCGTGFYCNPLLVRTVCYMNQLPFLTYKSRLIVLQDEVSVVAICWSFRNTTLAPTSLLQRSDFSLCSDSGSNQSGTTTCFIWFLKGNWKRKRGNNTAFLSTSS